MSGHVPLCQSLQLRQFYDVIVLGAKSPGERCMPNGGRGGGATAKPPREWPKYCLNRCTRSFTKQQLHVHVQACALKVKDFLLLNVYFNTNRFKIHYLAGPGLI